MRNLSPNGLQILQARYLHKTETPDALFQRVAKHLVTVEDKDHELWFDRFL